MSSIPLLILNSVPQQQQQQQQHQQILDKDFNQQGTNVVHDKGKFRSC